MNSLLLLPTWILNGGLGPQWLSLEAAILVTLATLLPPRRWARWTLWVAGALVAVLVLLGIADTAARMSLARSLNLYLDARLASSVVHLLDGAVAPGVGMLAVLGLVALCVGAAAGVGIMLSRLRSRSPGIRARVPALVVLALLVGAIPARWLHPAGVVAGLPSTLLVRQQTEMMTRMLGERARFGGEMATSPGSYRDTPGLLSRLGGRDVVLAFVESYGMTVLDDPRYAPVLLPRLDAMAESLDAAGLHVATGVLEAPSQGGMSWLGHGSILSGLWLENQLRYDLLLASDRETLVDDFEHAGYRTAALMPAITMAWPEGERFGYEQIFDFDRIDYAGPPLNWVTMPDQFTWSFMEHDIRHPSGPVAAGRDDRPVFVEVGLISSHAPWTPILTLEDDWSSVGDGSVFGKWDGAGETPEELWKDGDRVREHYAMSVAYAVDAAAGYAANFVDDDVVLIVLGDHQPAPLITGENAPRTVPVHVIASDPSVLEPFLRWGFVEGTLPPAERGPTVRRMDAFRDWFVRAFSHPAPAAEFRAD